MPKNRNLKVSNNLGRSHKFRTGRRDRWFCEKKKKWTFSPGFASDPFHCRARWKTGLEGMSWLMKVFSLRLDQCSQPVPPNSKRTITSWGNAQTQRWTIHSFIWKTRQLSLSRPQKRHHNIRHLLRNVWSNKKRYLELRFVVYLTFTWVRYQKMTLNY